MNDFLKKLLEGVPQQQDYAPLEQQDPYLDPKVLPSPLMTPVQSTVKELTTGSPAPLRPMSFEPENIVGKAEKPTLKPGLPPTTNEEDVNKLEIPEAPKRLSLQDILAPLSKQDDELAAAQQGNQDFIRMALLARAANKVGSSIAGVNADEKYGQDAIDFSNKKVSDLQERTKAKRDARNQAISEAKSEIDLQKASFELGDKEKENDPNSDVSKAFREYARSYVQQAGASIKIDDRLSMADLQKQMGTIGNIVSAKMAQDARRDNMALLKSQKDEASKAKLDDKNMQFMERQLKAMKESKNYKAAQTAENLIATLEDALKNPSAIKEIAATYQTVKSLDPDSAVREGEVGLLQQGVSLRAKADALASKLSDNPKIYGPQFLKAMQDYAVHQREVSRRMYEKEFNSIRNLGKRRGMSEEDVELMNPMPTSGYSTEVQKNAPQSTVSQEDKEAIEWAKANPNDPRSAQILKANGVK